MRRLTKKFRVLVAGTGLACAAVLATAPQASAITWDHTMHTNDGDPGGLIRFAAHGDYVEVCDIEADGYAVRGFVNDDHQHYYTLHRGGKGNCARTSAAVAGHNLTEGDDVYFQVALYKDGGENQYLDATYWWNPRE